MLVYNCSNISESERKIHILLKKYNTDVSFKGKPIIIIPLYGCGSCVEKALDFMKSEYDKGKYVFVLCALSKKEYSIKFGEEISSPYIICDTLNYARVNELVLSTPVIYFKNRTFYSGILKTDDDYKYVVDLFEDKL